MPDDVQAALARFQSFLEHYGIDAVIDARSGFTASDAQLLIGEIELAAQERRHEDDFDA
jgi:hypothetical protein